MTPADISIVLPSETFAADPHKGMGLYEWTSREKVKPLEITEFSSALDAMVNNAVRVYFVDEEACHKIQKADDRGLAILKSLRSENQKIANT